MCNLSVLDRGTPQTTESNSVILNGTPCALSSSSTAAGDFTTSGKKDVEKMGEFVNAVSTAGGFFVFTVGFAF